MEIATVPLGSRPLPRAVCANGRVLAGSFPH